MSKVEKLVNKLREAGWDIPKHYTFRRLYPGHWQRSSDHWSWEISYNETQMIGSPDSVTRLLKAKSFFEGPYGTIYGE